MSNKGAKRKKNLNQIQYISTYLGVVQTETISSTDIISSIIQSVESQSERLLLS